MAGSQVGSQKVLRQKSKVKFYFRTVRSRVIPILKRIEVVYFQKARTKVHKKCPMCNVPAHPKLHIPHDEDLEAEMNVERFELTKDGRLKFSHPEATHDDRLWAVALALSGTMKTEAPSRLMRAY